MAQPAKQGQADRPGRLAAYVVAAVLLSGVAMLVEAVAYAIVVFGGTGGGWTLSFVSLIALAVLGGTPVLISTWLVRLYHERTVPVPRREYAGLSC